MQTITTIGLDIAKSVFQVHGVDAEGNVVIRRQLKRRYVLAFFQKLPPCLIGIEACASSHYWSRELQALGHTVRLMPPAYVKPYVKRHKNDAIDAEAVKPVALPPGLGRLLTKPLPTGSATMTNMTGMVCVCCNISAVGGVFCVTMRSGCKAISSFADRCLISASSSAPQRKSSRVFWPSVQPRLRRPSRNTVTYSWNSGSLSGCAISTPIRRIRSGCCPSAASGHAATAPLTAVTNSRRLICRPQSKGCTPPHRDREYRVVHHSKFRGQCLSWVVNCRADHKLPRPVFPR
jgi:hypothetical protein